MDAIGLLAITLSALLLLDVAASQMTTTDRSRRGSADPARLSGVTESPATSLYDRAGGMPFFEAPRRPLLRRGRGRSRSSDPSTPKPTLAGARRRLTLFLAQYWGGPTTYDQERGHPRLRMRHAPFAIGPAARDRWLSTCARRWPRPVPPPDVAAELERYFEMAAEAMRNRD